MRWDGILYCDTFQIQLSSNHILEQLSVDILVTWLRDEHFPAFRYPHALFKLPFFISK